jgi:hypothetical protein
MNVLQINEEIDEERSQIPNQRGVDREKKLNKERKCDSEGERKRLKL